MPYFTIFPTRGTNDAVPANNPVLLEQVGEGSYVTSDTGGINFDLTRKKNACSKSFGYTKWSAVATDQATKCLGLFELYDGTNRDHIFFDNGRFYVYNGTPEPYEAILNFDLGTGLIAAGDTITDAGTAATAYVVTVTVTSGEWGTDAAGTLEIRAITGTFTNNNNITVSGVEAVVNGTLAPVTFATDNTDIYSIIRVGSYVVWADRAETTPYKWANGDDYVSKLDQSGGATEYKFRYIESFQRRVIGAYSDQANGNIDVRWSTSWPGTAITSLLFTATNQLYIPNDDPISGLKRMGLDRCFVYSENSIHSLDYYANFTSPFRLRNIIDGQGCASPYSIINLGDRHYFYNKYYGFCEFRGNEFPFGGRPISESIESTLAGINDGYVDLIVGRYLPMSRQCVWAVPLAGSTTNTHLLFYNVDSRAWTIEDKAMRYVDAWRMTTSQPTWNNLITDLGGAGATWSMPSGTKWSYYMGEIEKPVYANTDGFLYYHSGETLAGSALDGYRVEPILNFSGTFSQDILEEVWFDIGTTGNFSIDVSHRSGDTVGELVASAWSSLGSVSCNSSARPVLTGFSKTGRLHQVKWGTDAANESFEVSRMRFKYIPGSDA